MSADHALLVGAAKNNLITTRTSGYRSYRGSGYVGPNLQVHHVLPCISLTRSKDDFLAEQEPGVAQVVHSTVVYDVNETPNLLCLPTRPVYAAKYKTPFAINPKNTTPPATIDPLIASCDWPIHGWNHNPAYSKKAKTDADQVWANLALKIEEHKPVTAKDIHDAIANVSTALLGGITAKRAGTVAVAWHSGLKTAFDIL